MTRSHLPALCLLLVAGCDNTPVPSSVPLTEPALLTASGAPDEKSSLRFRATSVLAGTTSDVQLPFQGVTLQVSTAEGRASLDELALSLGAVDVSPDAMPPEGLRLSNVSIGMPRTWVEMGRRERDALSLSVQAPLELTWSLELPGDGGAWPMGTQRTEPIELSIDITRDPDGRARAEIYARCPGLCWELPGVASVRDLVVYAVVDAEIAPAP